MQKTALHNVHVRSEYHIYIYIYIYLYTYIHLYTHATTRALYINKHIIVCIHPNHTCTYTSPMYIYIYIHIYTPSSTKWCNCKASRETRSSKLIVVSHNKVPPLAWFHAPRPCCCRLPMHYSDEPSYCTPQTGNDQSTGCHQPQGA